MIEYDENNDSLHGKLIKTIVEDWVNKSLFEINNQRIRDVLKFSLDRFLPNINTNIFWDKNPEKIDKGISAGQIGFVDENGVNRVIDFCIMPTGTHIQ